MISLCRDCLFTCDHGLKRCLVCGSPRCISHPELPALSIAHIDCDAFYASVEKRDNPALIDQPVIVGSGGRGVVATACYIARAHGIHSAMPMFKAMSLCPDAVVIKPRMRVYTAEAKKLRSLMSELTPAVQPLSLDEAFLDLTGTERLHGVPPAVKLAQLIQRIHDELGLVASVGLSHNKFLAKVASNVDKPQGFFVIGKEETADFLRDKPIRLMWGVGKATQRTLEAAGVKTFSDLLRWEQQDLVTRFGRLGVRLWYLAHGEDPRKVAPTPQRKSISNEITFNYDTDNPEVLDGHLWRLAEKVADRAKAHDLAGRVVFIKLKCANHRSLTRQITLSNPTQLADRIYRKARNLLVQLDGKGPYRLLGCGLSDLCSAQAADQNSGFFAAHSRKRKDLEKATDQIRNKFGSSAIIKGRALR